jgi:hypothetical protein
MCSAISIASAILLATVAISGCGTSATGAGEERSFDGERSEGWNPGRYENGGGINSTPIKQNGEASHEFEPDDIERAEHAPPSVRAYCAGAVSEAQEVGCLSHVGAGEVP